MLIKFGIWYGFFGNEFEVFELFWNIDYIFFFNRDILVFWVFVWVLNVLVYFDEYIVY